MSKDRLTMGPFASMPDLWTCGLLRFLA